MTDAPAPIDPRHAALLAMDFQAGIVGRISDGDALLDRVAGAIALVRERGGTIGYVRVAFTDADVAAMPASNKMAATIAAAGGAFGTDAPGTAIDERIAPEDGDVVVRKTRVGPFLTTDLDAQLRERGITTLILAGISTSGVVLSTVRDAADRDYRLVVLADSCADTDPEVHQLLTTKVFPRQADVITTAALGELLAAPTAA